jgi:serine phosphatase RsbU (regulator of sigma subunit)/Tfp pilus assembly protein PilF
VKYFRLYLLLLLLFSGTDALTQNEQVDSLRGILESPQEDTSRVNTLNAMADLLYRSNPDYAIEYGSKAKNLAEEISYSSGLAMAYKNIGLGYYIQGHYTGAIENWEPALEIFEELGDEKMLANLLSNIGAAYVSMGQNVEAIEYSLRALKIAEKLDDQKRIGTLLNTIGLVYAEQPATYDTAINYFYRAGEIAESIGYVDLQGLCFVNLGEVYFEKENFDSALYYFEKSLTIVSDKIYIATALNFLGNIYAEKEDYQGAINYYSDALEMASVENFQLQMIGSLLGLASTYESQKNYSLAIDHYIEAENIAEQEGLQSELSSIYEGLATNYAELFDFTKAYKYLSLQNTIDNTVYKLESENQARDLISNYKLEKKQDEIAILEQKSEIEQLLSRRQRAMLIVTAVFGVFVLAMAGGLFQRMRYIRKTRDKMNAQNQMITDSISYAQRIQTAILPSQGLLDEVMPEHFVILKPKDIVSGDFYWVKEIQDHLVIVGADCTGHGVPGAFMSMLGITLLNGLIDDSCFSAPSDILEQLRVKVKEMLVQDGDSDEQKDGMDMALAIFNKTTRELHFAGANNPLYVIRNKAIPAGKDLEPYASTENGAFQLYELKGDKQPIGVHWEETKFTNRSITLSESDSFYLFSDGFVDQFGGEHRKKYKSSNFKKLLLSMQSEPMDSQKQLIDRTFEIWRGEYEQIDDVSVIGVRV